jgi:hopanoid C-2 methylase
MHVQRQNILAINDRVKPPASPHRSSFANLREGLRIMANLALRVGIMADYREVFWAHGRAAPARRSR